MQENWENVPPAPATSQEEQVAQDKAQAAQPAATTDPSGSAPAPEQGGTDAQGAPQSGSSTPDQAQQAQQPAQPQDETGPVESSPPDAAPAQSTDAQQQG